MSRITTRQHPVTPDSLLTDRDRLSQTPPGSITATQVSKGQGQTRRMSRAVTRQHPEPIDSLLTDRDRLARPPA